MAELFISYSSKDKDFTLRLAKSLSNLGHKVWLDEWEIHVGDSIVTKIDSGIERADFVALILSKNSTSSPWVEREWQAKYWDEVNKRKVMVLPILLDDCKIPTLLKAKKYADFREGYEIGLVQLATSLQYRYDIAGIERYHLDFVDFVDDWVDLFKDSSHLDLLMMYSATWMNTYFKHIQELLARPGGRLRIVFPELRADTALLQVYAERLEIDPEDLKERIITAIKEYVKLSSIGKVEIYTISKYLNHACYLFDTGGVVALYSYKSGRVPTPAFVLREGELLKFVRNDFEWLVSEQNRSRQFVNFVDYL